MLSMSVCSDVYVCVSVCLDVNQGGTNRIRCTVTCNIACTDLLMSPDRIPKTRSVWSTFASKSPAET